MENYVPRAHADAAIAAANRERDSHKAALDLVQEDLRSENALRVAAERAVTEANARADAAEKSAQMHQSRAEDAERRADERDAERDAQMLKVVQGLDQRVQELAAKVGAIKLTAPAPVIAAPSPVDYEIDVTGHTADGMPRSLHFRAKKPH